MNKYSLNCLDMAELRKIANKIGLDIKEKTKKNIINSISNAISECENYKVKKYTKKGRLGEKGKEGTTYLVTDKNNNFFAMKTFKKTKSSKKLKKEYLLQKKASKMGITPLVYDYDICEKWIVMEKMDKHLFESPETILTKKQQERIIEIFQKLDKAGVFHNDSNFLNYMIKNDKIYIIDFGYSKDITPNLIKELKTDSPNYRLMLIGLVLKLKEFNFKEKTYKYLLKHINSNDRTLYKL